MDSSQTTNRTVRIFKNLRPVEGVTIHFTKNLSTFNQFLDVCSEVLKINAQKVFDTIGDEILCLEQLIQNKDYYVSSVLIQYIKGEHFQVPVTRQDNKSQQNTSFYSTPASFDKQCIYQLVVMGAAAVGKSNLTLRYVKNETYENYDPTLEDEYQKRITINEKECKIVITDTAGQEIYTSLRTQWMKDKEGLIFIYAINSRESFDDLLNLLELFSSIDKDISKPAVLVIVGNKSDREQEREVTQEEGSKLAKQFNGLFFETSAKSGMNVDRLFSELIQKINSERQIIKLRRKFSDRLKKDNSEDNSCSKCQLI